MPPENSWDDDDYICSPNSGFACIDPTAACVDDDDATTLSIPSAYCIDEFSADGDCDGVNNNDGCGAWRSVTRFIWRVLTIGKALFSGFFCFSPLD